MSQEKIAVETRGLTKIYGDGAQIRALDQVDLTIHAGEFIAIVGPSGSGKSTLLNLLGALDRPTQGDIWIGGTLLSRVRNLDRFRSQTVGFIFQTHNLIPTLTARENIEIPMYELGMRESKRRARALELLSLVGLAQRSNHLPNQMSGGERQRVATARALANHPTLVLADEPTGNLDSKTTQEIMDLLSDLNRTQGTTLIVVTHNHEVARATRRIITLRDGKIQRDIAIANPFQSDLYDLKSSLLGQAILKGEAVPEDMREFAPQLRQVLEKV